MSVKSAPFYWLECDAPLCKSRCPNEDDEHIAYSDDEGAIEVARASDWKRTNDERDYCDAHALNVCEQCERYDATSFPGEREYLCMYHWLASKVAP